MVEQRVSLFVSHKVKYHKEAAKRIKEILQARAERLDVYICEDNGAGAKWLDLMQQKLSDAHVLLLLLPPSNADIDWIKTEIKTFQEAHPNGWIVPFKSEDDGVPDFLKDRQVVDATKENFFKFFLTPLFIDGSNTGLRAPLNPRIKDFDLLRDAKEIADIVRGLAPFKSCSYGEYFVVEVCGLDVSKSFNEATVFAPDGCIEILNWQKKEFSWLELVAWVNEEHDEDTYWVIEMEDVIKAVCNGKSPPVMTSTFRGRGGASVSRIFEPHLYNIDYVNDNPVRFYFSFHQALTPELIRGSGQIVDIFNALYTATRMRWEIIHPFYINKVSHLPTDAEEQKRLINHVINSFRVIDEFSERYNIIGDAYNSFKNSGNENLLELVQLIKMRKTIKDNLIKAAKKNNFKQFIDQLSKALPLNLRATEMLAEEYLKLIREDHNSLKEILKI